MKAEKTQRRKIRLENVKTYESGEDSTQKDINSITISDNFNVLKADIFQISKLSREEPHQNRKENLTVDNLYLILLEL